MRIDKILILLLFSFSACTKAPMKNENWDNGSPKIRINVEKYNLKHGDLFYRKYVKYYSKNETHPNLNYNEDWFNQDGHLFLNRQIRNGELNGAVKHYNNYGFIESTYYYNNGELIKIED